MLALHLSRSDLTGIQAIIKMGKWGTLTFHKEKGH